MKMKAVVESILVGTISAMLSYRVLISPATIAAIAIRGKIPDAWFSGLITWYAAFFVIGISIVIAGVACRIVYRQVSRSTPRS